MTDGDRWFVAAMAQCVILAAANYTEQPSPTVVVVLIVLILELGLVIYLDHQEKRS